MPWILGVVPHSLNETDMVGEVDSDRSWTEDCLLKSGVKPRKEWGTGVQLPRQHVKEGKGEVMIPTWER